MLNLIKKATFFATLIALFGVGFMLLDSKPVLAAAQCFSETNSGVIERFPVCDYGPMSESGFTMGQLPNPLSPDACYFWPSDSAAPGQVVSCTDPRFVNAAGFGSTTPPPVSLENGAANVTSTKLQGEIDNPQRVNCNSEDSCVNDNPLTQTIIVAINLLSGAVGIVVVIVIIIAGIQYTTAGGNPNATSAAKKRITNAVIALVAYLLLFMFMQWLIPGGLL